MQLGITRDRPRPAQLQAITQARAHTRDHAPERSTRAQLQADGRKVARQLQRDGAHEQEGTPSPRRRNFGTHPRMREQRQQQAPRSFRRQLQDLAARLEGEEVAHGAGLRVRLHEREREREREQGQGMGL